MNKKKNTPKEIKTQYTAEFKVNNSQQLLAFLLSHLSKQSRNNVKTMLKKHCVLVDGVVVTQFDYLLVPKQLVQISKEPVKSKARGKENSLDIIYEDEEFIVVNKKAGVLSIATDKEKENTVYHQLVNYVRSQNKHNQVFVVHRLDKDTSGVLMIAKNPSIRDKLQDDWNNIVTKREYYALVKGTMPKKEDTLVNYLCETSTHIVYVDRGKEGKKAITHYQVIKENKQYSLLKVDIETGRKNQIRVQLAFINHPVVGDEKYGEKESPIKRLGLHANILEFRHPVSGKIMHFETKIPGEFTKLFAK